MDKIKKAITHINQRELSGNDGIPTEVYKAARPNILDVFPDSLLSIWEEGMIPGTSAMP